MFSQLKRAGRLLARAKKLQRCYLETLHRTGAHVCDAPSVCQGRSDE